MGKRMLALLCALALPWGAFAEEAEGGLETRLERIFARYHTLGASVAVIENGQVTRTYCYGVTRLGGDPVTPECGFQVGSISKMVANIGLMRLVEQGRASLDSDLSELFGFSVRNPAFPDDPVTLRQLMTHTASLRDSSYYEQAVKNGGLPLSELFSLPLSRAVFNPKARPGMESVYCNFGGGLIGALMERLTGQTVDDYMRENVFAPLNIRAAYQASLLAEDMPLCDMYHMPEKKLAKRLRDDPTHIVVPDFERDYFLTAGKLILSAPDLAKLLIVLCDGGMYRETRILKEKTVREMRTPQNDRESVFCQSGRGLFLNIIENYQVEGRTMYGHGGLALGMLCAAYFDPTDRTGVVMLTNGCDNQKSYHGVGALGRVVMAAIYGDLEAAGHRREEPFSVE